MAEARPNFAASSSEKVFFSTERPRDSSPSGKMGGAAEESFFSVKSSDDDDGTATGKKDLEALQAVKESRRQDLIIAENELARLKENYSDFFDHDQELDDLLGKIESDPNSYLAPRREEGDKKVQPFVKKLALALQAQKEAQRSLEASEIAVRDINLTPGEIKAMFQEKMKEQDATIRNMEKRIEVLESVLVSVVTSPQFSSCFKSYTRLDDSFDSNTSLMNHASSRKQGDVVDFLLKHGVRATCMARHVADDNSDRYYDTPFKHDSPLNIAVLVGDIIGVTKLIENGADVDEIVPFSPAFLDSGYLETITDFEKIKNQLKSKLKNVSCHSPLQVAAIVAELNVVELLVLKYEAKGVASHDFYVPNGPKGDLVAGFLQTRGSKPVRRF